MEMRPKKCKILYVLNPLRLQLSAPYGRHHGAVIVILLDIIDCNVLIVLELSLV